VNRHRDFVFATRSRTLQLRYLVRLYVMELVLKNLIMGDCQPND
jgi:hypothetical protein